MLQAVEQQVVQALLGILALAVTSGIGYLAPRAKNWLSVHASARTADVGARVIDGLSSIAHAVVQDFNQRVVVDAKKSGTWTPQLAQSVKDDAIKAVMDQGSQLVALGQSVVGNVQSLVSSLVEQAVASYHVSPKVQVAIAEDNNPPAA